MARIGPRDTKPEMVVRRLLHCMGHRFRLQRRDLPGTPDIVLPRYRKAIFFHGRYRYRHPGCRKASTPKTRRPLCQAKFDANIERDERKEKELLEAGCDVLVKWECETKNIDELYDRLSSWMGSNY